jgi:hypothetical protein
VVVIFIRFGHRKEFVGAFDDVGEVEKLKDV